MKTTLDSGRALQLEGGPRGLELGCVSGQVWVTQAGDRSDYLLSAGQHLRFPPRGSIVVEALTNRAILWQES